MDPEVFALSVGMLGWPLAVARLLATLVLSLGAGYLTLTLVRGGFLGGKVLRRGVLEKYGEDETEAGEGCCEASAPRELALVAVGSKPLPDETYSRCAGSPALSVQTRIIRWLPEHACATARSPPCRRTDAL